MERDSKTPAEALKELVQNFAGAKPSIGKVKRGTVDEEKKVCEIAPTDGGPKISRAFLNVMSESNLVVVPADDSYVAYIHAGNFKSQAYIVACSKIRKIILKTSPAGTLTFELSDAGAEIKVGDQGRVKIDANGTIIGNGEQKQVRGDELKTLLQQILALLNTMVTWGAGVTPPLAGAVVPTIPATLLSSKNKVE